LTAGEKKEHGLGERIRLFILEGFKRKKMETVKVIAVRSTPRLGLKKEGQGGKKGWLEKKETLA